jgi:hypothetical protein
MQAGCETPEIICQVGSQKISGQITRIACLPHTLIATLQPTFEIVGPQTETVVIVRNVDGCHGRLLAGRILDELLKLNKPLHEGCTDTFVLHDLADQLLQHFRANRTLANISLFRQRQHCIQRIAFKSGDPGLFMISTGEIVFVMKKSQSHRLGVQKGWCVKRVNDHAYVPELWQRHHCLEWSPCGGLKFTGPCTLDFEIPSWDSTWLGMMNRGYSMRKHRDQPPGGSLLCIFNVGLDCSFQTWPGKHLEEHTLHSGDAMLFDGSVVEHAVTGLGSIDTSPFPRCPWLSAKRLSVLVRQPAPHAPERIFRIGKHRGYTFAWVREFDESYCTWARQQDQPCGDLEDFVQFLERS